MKKNTTSIWSTTTARAVLAGALALTISPAWATLYDMEGELPVWDSVTGTLPAIALDAAAAVNGSTGARIDQAAGQSGTFAKWFRISPDTRGRWFMCSVWLRNSGSGGSGSWDVYVGALSANGTADLGADDFVTKADRDLWYLLAWHNSGTAEGDGGYRPSTDTDWHPLGLCIYVEPAHDYVALAFRFEGDTPAFDLDDLHVTVAAQVDGIDCDDDPYVPHGTIREFGGGPSDTCSNNFGWVPPEFANNLWNPSWCPAEGTPNAILGSRESGAGLKWGESGASLRVTYDGSSFADISFSVPFAGLDAGAIYAADFWNMRTRDAADTAWKMPQPDSYFSHLAWSLDDIQDPGDIEAWKGNLKADAWYLAIESNNYSTYLDVPHNYRPGVFLTFEPTTNAADYLDAAGHRYATKAFSGATTLYYKICTRAKQDGSVGTMYLDDIRLWTHGSEDLADPLPPPTPSAGMRDAAWRSYR